MFFHEYPNCARAITRRSGKYPWQVASIRNRQERFVTLNLKIVITAGRTRERIDAVRFLSNRSTGKMGYALASAAVQRGWEVVLISGPVTLCPPENVTFVAVESAAEMAEAVKNFSPTANIIIMAAAVADYRPVNPLPNKMKKLPGNLTLELERTEDILAGLGKNKPQGQILVGFAAETDDLLTNASEKLKRKNLDWICANDVSRSDRGFGSSDNAVTILGANGEKIELPLADKHIIANKILDTICYSGKSI